VLLVVCEPTGFVPSLLGSTIADLGVMQLAADRVVDRVVFDGTVDVTSYRTRSYSDGIGPSLRQPPIAVDDCSSDWY
jgi:hypothetical protein